MRTSDFDFTLPQERIALYPAFPKESAKLLEVEGGHFSDRAIADLPELLAPGDLLIFNDSKVIPARLFATNISREGRPGIEVLLHQQVRNGWKVFAKPGKKLKEGDILEIAPGFHAEVVQKHKTGEVTLSFNASGTEFFVLLEAHGHMPLPPYIAREDKAEDKQHYQTLFAKHEGSVAAPTAGLHFTSALMEQLKARGVNFAYVTLHVGAGTFQPVKAERVQDHQMHAEYYTLTQETVDAIQQTKQAGGRVIAVGTTSLRTLEGSELKPGSGETRLFITPGFRFKVVDMLITNFHLPRSTLLMLVSAFAGQENIRRAYAHAIASDYRFYSYGDACLLHKSDDWITG